jgi:hypothetical protein
LRSKLPLFFSNSQSITAPNLQTTNMKKSPRLHLPNSKQVRPFQPSHPPTDLNELQPARRISKRAVRPKMLSTSIPRPIQKLRRYSLRQRDLGWVVRVRIDLRLLGKLLLKGLLVERELRGRLRVGRMWEERLQVKLQRRGSAQWLRKSAHEPRDRRGLPGGRDGEVFLPPFTSCHILSHRWMSFVLSGSRPDPYNVHIKGLRVSNITDIVLKILTHSQPQSISSTDHHHNVSIHHVNQQIFGSIDVGRGRFGSGHVARRSNKLQPSSQNSRQKQGSEQSGR